MRMRTLPIANQCNVLAYNDGTCRIRSGKWRRSHICSTKEPLYALNSFQRLLIFDLDQHG